VEVFDDFHSFGPLPVNWFCPRVKSHCQFIGEHPFAILPLLAVVPTFPIRGLAHVLRLNLFQIRPFASMMRVHPPSWILCLDVPFEWRNLGIERDVIKRRISSDDGKSPSISLNVPHACFLQLLIWPARFNRLMLPRIANQ
jgi:hypothetical protein